MESITTPQAFPCSLPYTQNINCCKKEERKTQQSKFNLFKPKPDSWIIFYPEATDIWA